MYGTNLVDRPPGFAQQFSALDFSWLEENVAFPVILAVLGAWLGYSFGLRRSLKSAILTWSVNFIRSTAAFFRGGNGGMPL